MKLPLPKACIVGVSSCSIRSLASSARATPRQLKKRITRLPSRHLPPLSKNVIKHLKGKLFELLASILKLRKGETDVIMDGNLESPPEPVKKVTFLIFDNGVEWDAVVNFYDDPVDVIEESITMAYEVVERAKLEAAGS